ncbi:hypothetical protein A3J90_02785 [candidate division WOR-1 bacterium RIFOXYC2_FULL_37_10]|uniref:SHS2 domain-containing protein n=1 Tax=candidate division WOR-1 bacterium RIFOXYB2_FULL_37_13 TaxID=1802579 RepID=A0A1F4SPG5_UNCSA|nr:MAG: hypothetical protein A2310_01465 [candidate division WOR-1 bacterium RIFOXYB2_FULL_37_13]OGC34539.1 MAG: hypothetical protein A3J90_02785 [candidate division WOR-1 bacterium RIFOXYC2_FULL_37_10]
MAEKNILGIDLRVCSVKVVELKKGIKGWELLKWGMEEVPYDLLAKHPNKEIAQGKVLKQILSEKSIAAKEAIVVVGGTDVVSKTVSIPHLSSEELSEAIKWKMKDDISYPTEEALVDFVPVGKIAASGDTDYLVSCAHKDTISSALAVIREAGLQINSIVTLPFALRELCISCLPENGVVSVVYMGRRTTNISFFKNGKLVFNREISIGGEDITRAMTSALTSEGGRIELNYEEAEKIKKEHGVPTDLEAYPKLEKIPVLQLQAVVRPALEKIEDEFLRTIEYFKSQEGEVSIQKMMITGGASKTPHVLEFLAEGLGIPFERFDIMPEIMAESKIADEEQFKTFFPQLSAAMGAAMTFSKKGINLLPLEIKDKNKLLIRKYFKPVPIIAALALILLIVYGVMFYIDSGLKKTVAEVEKQVTELKPKVERLLELERIMREEQGRKGIFKSIELSRIEIQKILEEISYSIPPSVKLKSISFVESSKKIKLSGIAFERGNSSENVLSKLVLDLSKSPSFAIVELVSATKNSEFIYGALDFEIDGVVRKRQ